MKMKTEGVVNLEDEFYIIELNTKSEKAMESIFKAPHSVMETLHHLNEFVLITPPGPVMVPTDKIPFFKGIDFFLYSNRLGVLVRIDPDHNYALHNVFYQSYLKPEETILHFGRIIPSYSVSDGKEEPSIKAFIPTEEIDYYTLETEDVGLKEVFTIMKDIGLYRYDKHRGLIYRFFRWMSKLFGD